MKVQAYSYGRETYSFRGYFSKGTCQMINDTLTGREGVKMDAMRVFRQTKRPSLIGGGLSWLNIRLGARISCHKHYSTGKEHTRQRITPPHQQQARHGEKVHSFPFLLFHSGGDHQRAHVGISWTRAARYSLSIIPSNQRAIPMHGTATTSPMPGRGRWAQGRGAHPCQGSRYYPIGVCANGRPPRPSPLFCDF